MNRREFLKRAGVGALGLAMSTSIVEALAKSGNVGKRAPKILIVSGWQDVNIGDIAHTPGLIAVIKNHIPDAEIIVWKRSRSEKVDALLKKHFPNILVLHGGVDKVTGQPQTAELQKAFAECDMFIHGSGAAVSAPDYLAAWWKQTHKPFGVFGVTIYGPHLDYIPAGQVELMNNATFFFTRETASLEIVKKAGMKGDGVMFVPDAVFGMQIRDDAWADKFMADHGLEEKKFICVIPRHRINPYHRIRKKNNWTNDKIMYVDALNEAKMGQDLLQACKAITVWVRETANKVLLCPEVTVQVELYPFIMENLPDDVKKNVVQTGYWMPDEATSIYAKAHTLLSYDCHSPIMALGHGTPAFYLKQPEDTIKGQMFYDLGLGDWVFEIEESTGDQIAERLMGVYKDYAGATAKLNKAMRMVNDLYDKGFKIINKVL